MLRSIGKQSGESVESVIIVGVVISLITADEIRASVAVIFQYL